MSLQDLIILQEKCEELEVKLEKAKEALRKTSRLEHVDNVYDASVWYARAAQDAKKCLKELEE